MGDDTKKKKLKLSQTVLFVYVQHQYQCVKIMKLLTVVVAVGWWCLRIVNVELRMQ